MAKSNELRDMSDEQLGLTLKEAAENLFRLRIQSQTERLDAPSELRRNRRLIARIKTIQTQRAKKAAAAAVVSHSRSAARLTTHARQLRTKHAQTTSHRRRDERQDEQDRAAWRSTAWCGTRSTASSCAAARCATCTTRTTSRTMGDTVEIIEAPPALED